MKAEADCEAFRDCLNPQKISNFEERLESSVKIIDASILETVPANLAKSDPKLIKLFVLVYSAFQQYEITNWITTGFTDSEINKKIAKIIAPIKLFLNGSNKLLFNLLFKTKGIIPDTDAILNFSFSFPGKFPINLRQQYLDLFILLGHLAPTYVIGVALYNKSRVIMDLGAKPAVLNKYLKSAFFTEIYETPLKNYSSPEFLRQLLEVHGK